MLSSSAQAATLSLEGRTLDEAEELGSVVFHPHRLRALAQAGPLRLGVDALSVRDITVGIFQYTCAVRIETGPYDDWYHVNIPLEGEMRTAVGSERVLAIPRRGAVYRRDVPTIIEGFEDGNRVLGVKIPRDALERRLTQSGGAVGPGGIAFDPTIDLESGWGRTWRWHVAACARQLDAPGELMRHPLLVGALRDALLDGLLRATRHPAPPLPVEPPMSGSAVDRIAQLMRASPELHFGTELLCELSGTSSRAVQQGFRRHFGVTPQQFVRRARLERVRRDLRAQDGTETIAASARRWGFAHLGRFSAEYAARFGELPSQTLGASATAAGVRRDTAATRVGSG